MRPLFKGHEGGAGHALGHRERGNLELKLPAACAFPGYPCPDGERRSRSLQLCFGRRARALPPDHTRRREAPATRAGGDPETGSLSSSSLTGI